MLDALRAYGPDSRDLWHGGNLSLGRCLYRLLPEDRSDRQSLVGGGGRYTLVADLRLDDRDSISARLGDSAPSAEASDAQFLLKLVERFGASVLETLVGDFAVALWDAAERRLTLARDPLGQRPLHYHAAPGFFAFASLPKGLHALEAIPRHVDEERLARFIGLMPLVGGSGFYTGIRRVQPGHLVEVTPDSVLERRYFRPERRDLGLRDFGDYRDAFRAELDRAVRSRLRGARTILATHLSAGWDSSAVTATAARLAPAGTDILSYTSVPRRGNDSGAPGNRLSDEGDIAAATAALHPGVTHVRVPGSAASPIAGLDRYVSVFDRPLYNLCNAVWLTQIREHASAQGARVLLTGEHGNWTVSAGPYSVLADMLRRGRWLAWAREAGALAIKRRARLRGIAAFSLGPWVPDAVWKAVRRLSSRPETNAYTALHPRLAGFIDAERERNDVGLAWRPKDHFTATLRALGHYDFGELRKGVLAGWGVDERDPTADRRLIEFCLSLPVDMLLKDGERRPLARAALSDRLPPTLLNETRKGYQAADWHEGMTAHRTEIEALLERIAADPLAASLLDVTAMRSWVRDWPEGGWERPEVMARYRGALLTGLSAGHFILTASA
ncbi:MAG TPA: asparagine synthase-related protein [Allosphingosinicella sp.]|nr:asparagine synthase-related protein [Allosphingosinicella sp.]